MTEKRDWLKIKKCRMPKNAQKCQTGKFKERANEVTGESICTMQAEFTNGGLKRRLTYVLCPMVQSKKKKKEKRKEKTSNHYLYLECGNK